MIYQFYNFIKHNNCNFKKTLNNLNLKIIKKKNSKTFIKHLSYLNFNFYLNFFLYYFKFILIQI